LGLGALRNETQGKRVGTKEFLALLNEERLDGKGEIGRVAKKLGITNQSVKFPHFRG